MEKVSVFIDGNNFYYGLRLIYGKNKSLKKFNFEKFINFLVENNELVETYYYNAQLDKSNDFQKFLSQKEFFNKLKQIPNFNLVLCKLLKRKIPNSEKYYYVLKEDDINMAVNIVEDAYDNKFDIAILISGDGDFVPAVKSVKKRKKKIINIYFKKSSSRNLKQHCHKSLELNKDLLDEFFD
ncbi:NYN domain-containing protein [Candidatus Pacearchaeota archaeon]|nr:NYN domain-containing protein [Candidatus Pacearchaeota archaeon]